MDPDPNWIHFVSTQLTKGLIRGVHKIEHKNSPFIDPAEKNLFRWHYFLKVSQKDVGLKAFFSFETVLIFSKI